MGVGYGTDPELVLKLLVAEAAAHADVMTDPAPMAFFMGFGDSALNFELRFWSARQDIWLQLKSDVTIGVSRALNEAGIKIPFPQRDLHLHSAEVSIPEIDLLNPTAPSARQRSQKRKRTKSEHPMNTPARTLPSQRKTRNSGNFSTSCGH